MPEVIKTILTGDSSELRTEFERAAGYARAYQEKQQAGFAKALSGHDNELRALRLEADGFTRLATSMRESTAMREQAARLATSANITIQQATGLLEEEYRLRKNITIAAAQQAAASQAAAARASAIANPRTTGLPGGGGLAPLTPQSLQAMERGIASTRELQRQTLLAGQSGKNGALGFLAFSQAVEDAQYGIRGVLNNIPQMILGFGGTAGLAGAISLAAVAGATLYPVLKKLYGAFDTEAVKAAGNAFNDAFKKGLQVVDALRTDFSIQEMQAEIAGNLNNYFQQRLQLGATLDAQNDRQLKADREKRELAMELLGAREKLAELNGGNLASLREEKNKMENRGISSDIVNREKELADVQAKALLLIGVRDNIAAEAAEKEERRKAKLILLTDQLVTSEANLAATQAEKKKREDSDPLVKGTYGFLGIDEINQKENVAKIKKEIDIYKARTQTIKDGYEKAIQDSNDAIRKLDERTNKTNEETQALKALIEQRKTLQQIDRQQDAAKAAREAKKEWDAFRKTQESVVKEAQASMVEWKKIRKEQEAQRASENKAKADFATENTALRLEISGRKDLAEQLRKEAQIRSDAAEFAKAANISEKDALGILRQRAALQEQAKRAKRAKRGRNPLGTRNPGAIRRAPGGVVNAGGGRRIEAGGGRQIGLGVRDSILSRRAAVRKSDTAPAKDPTIKLLEDSRDFQEQMLKIWQGIQKV